MGYRHILVAVDLSKESECLLEKGIRLAEPLNARLSLINIDVGGAELYGGLIDINLASHDSHPQPDRYAQLQQLANRSRYPIYKQLLGVGELSDEICSAIGEQQVDLVICGHHQDFWSKILSSAKQLINVTPVDLLMVPLDNG